MNAAASKGEHIRSEDRPPSWTPKRRDIAPGVDHGGGAIAEIVRDTQGALVTTVYPHADALGSPNLFVNEDGDLTRQGFAPFGQPVAAMPPGDTDSLIGFTGHDHDAELGLINMQGRIYDPTLGRFLTADPIIQSPFWSQGLNRYAYVFNSPMNLVDPSGFSAIGDYFQSLNDAPPEHAVPGYIGTGLVAGLAAAAIYEGVSASFSAGSASAISAGTSQAGGGAPVGRGVGGATVAIQRIKAATEDSVTREPGPVPSRSTTRPIGSGKAHATGQIELRIPRRPSMCASGQCVAGDGAGGASAADGGGEGTNGTGHYAPIIDDGGAGAEVVMCMVPQARLFQMAVRAGKAAQVFRAAKAATKLLNPPIKITPQGLGHVIERHTHNGISKFAAKSKFNADEDVVGLIESATQQRMVLQPNGNYARSFDAGRSIGFDRNVGSQTSWLTVITKPDGSLVTAFPGLP